MDAPVSSDVGNLLAAKLQGLAAVGIAVFGGLADYANQLKKGNVEFSIKDVILHLIIACSAGFIVSSGFAGILEILSIPISDRLVNGVAGAGGFYGVATFNFIRSLAYRKTGLDEQEKESNS